MSAADKLSKILEVLESGKTLYISTAMRHTKITIKNVRQFEAAGRPLFKTDSKSLYMSVGKRYDCIDYCKFTVEG